MKGPYEYGKVYAIAAVASAGFAGGVVPAVYAYDRRTAEDMFFTIGDDEFDAKDVYEVVDSDGKVRLDSGDDPGWRVPPRQVLSLWSDREEALLRYKARSERGKQASLTKKTRVTEERLAARSAEEVAKATTAEGRLEAIPGVDYVSRIIHGERDVVMFALKVKPDTFRKLTLALGIDQELVEEWLTESAEAAAK